MATAPMSADPSRLSFAKVAASTSSDNIGLASFVKVTASIRESRKENESAHLVHHKITEGQIAPVVMSNPASINQQALGLRDRVSAPESETSTAPQNEVTEAKLIEAVQALKVGSPMPSLVVNGSGTVITRESAEADACPEEISVRADSGSDLGTKPPSLDGKSITSGTTFALDEKESLRPDDSASVKAAEDDDTFSGRGSIVAGSRIGSEAAARAYRAQHYDVLDRRNIHTLQEHQVHGVFTSQSGLSEQRTRDDSEQKAVANGTESPDAFSLFYRQTPDEKVLEALESPKDRIFLLRLEQFVIEFVKDSKEPFIDLPPCNSFCRMLTHKLADYYHMTHQVDAVAGAVRIFRTPFCRLPPPLTTISNPPTSGSTPPPSVLPAMKIMRRGRNGGTGQSPSKTASEAGSDGKDKSLSAKEKLSREEREAAYNRARERIFGKDDKNGQITPDTEDGNELSRSSSICTKDRSLQNKRGKTGKQRRDDAESFDVRSQYTPYYPQPQQATWAPANQYSPMGIDPYVSPVSSNFHSQGSQQFGVGHQHFGPPMMNNGSVPPFVMPQFCQPGRINFRTEGSQPSSYNSSQQLLGHSSLQWSQNLYQDLYQARGQPAHYTQPGQTKQLGSAVSHPQPNSIPYLFGQLPSTINSADPKSQHPIPGSFNRHAFNPKTQSFVPGNAGPPQIQQALSQHGSPRRATPQHGSPHVTYNAFPPPPQQFGNGMSYALARQGSNNSVPSYHGSPHMAPRQLMQGMVQNIPQHMINPQAMTQTMPHGGHAPHNISQGMPSNSHGSHLPHFGNPSTLPPKPPAGL